MNSDCGKSWEAVLQGEASVTGEGATFRVWSGEASLNATTIEPRPGKLRRSCEGSWKVSWERKPLIWVLKGPVCFPELIEKDFLCYWVKRRR